MARGLGSLSSQAALAQDAQTVEGAQQFLTMTSADGLQLRHYNPPQRKGKPVFGAKNFRMTNQFGSRWKFFSTLDKCKSAVLGYSPLEFESITYHGSQEAYYTTTITFADSIDIDWGAVSDVKELGGNVLVSTSRGTITIKYPSENLSARAAYAMKFLSLECDKTASTGF